MEGQGRRRWRRFPVTVNNMRHIRRELVESWGPVYQCAQRLLAFYWVSPASLMRKTGTTCGSAISQWSRRKRWRRTAAAPPKLSRNRLPHSQSGGKRAVDRACRTARLSDTGRSVGYRGRRGADRHPRFFTRDKGTRARSFQNREGGLRHSLDDLGRPPRSQPSQRMKTRAFCTGRFTSCD